MKRDEEEIRLTCEELPQQPDNDIILRVKAMQRDKLLVYRASRTLAGERAALLRCTGCGGEIFAEWVPKDEVEGCRPYSSRPGFKIKRVYESGSVCMCPACGATTRAIHVSAIGNDGYVIETTWFMTMHNVRGHFVLLAWKITKLCDKQAVVRYDVTREYGTAIIGGIPIRFAGTSFCFGVTRHIERWTTLKKYKEFPDKWKRTEIINFDENTIFETECANSALEVYMQSEKELPVSQYLRLWTKYPAVENLVRNGFGAFIASAIDACAYTGGGYYRPITYFAVDGIKKYIDVKKKKPHEMLRIEKCDTALAKSFDGAEVLRLYAAVWSMSGVKLTKDALLRIRNKFDCGRVCWLLETEVPQSNRVTAIRVINYLQKHGKKNTRIDCGYLHDYWRMASRIYDEIPEELILPRDLIREHDKMAMQTAEKDNEKLSEKITAVSKKMEWLSYENATKGLLIRPCRSYGELFAEGNQLHHCVATYAKECAEGSTFIFFIRRTAQPDTPYYTLELKGERVAQNRGLHNCDRTQEIKDFEAEWLEHIKQIQEVKNGKRDSRKKKREYAGA